VFDKQTLQISAIIVNYCQWEDTANLTRQILSSAAAKRGEIEVTIVDNYSLGHPLASQIRRWPGVSLRRWRRNRGFAQAVNEGCRLSRGEWFLLLNPDVTLTDRFVEGVLALSRRLPDASPRVGVVGFHLHHSNGSRQRSTGRFPTLLTGVLRLLLPRHRRKYSNPPIDRPSAVSWAAGCCLLVRRKCLEQVRGFDNDYFLYYEDVDFCRRAQAAGWRVRYEPNLHAIHHRPLHSRAVSSALRVFTRHALLTYAVKHWPWWQWRSLAAGVRLEAWLRGLRARRCGQLAAAAHFQELGGIVRALAGGRRTEARRRLKSFVCSQE
jgi:GT2 family glycosyltransferase